MLIMPGRLVEDDPSKDWQDQVEASLAHDPNYRFIRDLLQAVADAGLALDKLPQLKAQELYARYQRENRIASWTAESE